MNKTKTLKINILSAVLLVIVAGLFLLAGFYFSADAKANVHQNNYIIKFKNSNHLSELNNFGANIEQKFEFSSVPTFKNIYSFNSHLPLAEIKEILKGKFEYIEKNKIFKQERVVVNDPGFTENTLDIDKQWAIPKAGFNKAWEKTKGSVNNVVAVIDTGVDGTHEDLQNINFVKGFDFFTNQEITGYVNSDDNGHGTLVAGILGASANNGLGIVGTNWQISIMPIKALNSQGNGDSSDVAEAIVWATDNGAQIINLSLGGGGFGQDTTLANAVTYAFGKNVLIVAAAGNDVTTTGGNLDKEPVFPICDDNGSNMVLGVAAVGHMDIKPKFSNYGKNCIDVVAPGKRILSTINHDPFTKAAAPNSYAYASGTSLAVPFVSGQAAIIRSIFPQATNVQIRDRIISSADSVDNLNLSQCDGRSCRGLLGTGRINVLKSIESAISTQTILEGDLVQLEKSKLVYYISGGKKRLVSPFVYNQRFFDVGVKVLPENQLNSIPDGPYATPNEGTLVKLNNDPTVYIISRGKKLPVTLLVFRQRSLSFSDVKTVSFSELNSWIQGNFLPPVEGSLLRTFKDKTVYWIVGGVLHPINYDFYIQRGLNVFPVIFVPDSDLENLSRGGAYIR